MILSPENQKIKNQFDDVIRHCYGIDNPKTNLLFEDWLNGKHCFLRAFGGPILELGHVKMGLSESAKNERLNKFIQQVEDQGYDDLADFVRENKNGFFDNKVVYSKETVWGDKIPSGMKLLKSFKYYTNSKFDLDHFQNMASCIIQEDKIEGTLCLSVHPLDYLSLSENCHNWRSCHALDGDYAEGNLNYMIDSSTVICYIKSDNGDVYHLPNFPSNVPWNSKKWRMLVFLSDGHNALMAGKPYPFELEGILPKISDAILTKMCLKSNCSLLTDIPFEELQRYTQLLDEEDYNNIVATGWSRWKNKYINNLGVSHLRGRHVYMANRIYCFDADFIADGPNTKHFNDLMLSSTYLEPYYCYDSNSGAKIKFSIGKEAYCLECGNYHSYTAGLMRCNDCLLEYQSDGHHCDICGSNIYTDDYIELYDGSIACVDCGNVLIQCDKCGYFMSNMEAIKHEGNKICPYCKNELEENE